MKILFNLCIAIGIAALLSSCAPAGKVTYFQNINKEHDLRAYQNYEPTIKKDDILNIIVSGPDKDVVMPYNIGEGSADRMSYIVDINGEINFPVLGKIHAEGLTLRALSDLLTSRISEDVKNPIVNASYANYKVTILGEVNSPGTYSMEGERTTILQAIGMAGDLNLGGKRGNILLIREIDGKYEHIRIDLRKTDILSSPYYYLCQNDVIYVAPTSARAFSGSSQGSIIPILASTVGLVLSIIALARIK